MFLRRVKLGDNLCIRGTLEEMNSHGVTDTHTHTIVILQGYLSSIGHVKINGSSYDPSSRFPLNFSLFEFKFGSTIHVHL